MMTIHAGRLLLSFALALATAAFARPAEQSPAAPERVAQPGTAAHGREIYTGAGCSSCHASTLSHEARSPLILAAHPLEGAPFRGTWWNGRITTDVGEASDFCLRTFLDPKSEGFTAEERKALVLFMQELGSERGISPLAMLRRDAGDVDLRAGDATRGRELYQRACVSCHTVAGREPSLVERELVGDLSPAQVAEIIRKGKDRMPFFQVDRLSSPQVADIAAYLEPARNSR